MLVPILWRHMFFQVSLLFPLEKLAIFCQLEKCSDPLYPHFNSSERLLPKLVTPCFSRHLAVAQSDCLPVLPLTPLDGCVSPSRAAHLPCQSL